MTRKEHKALKHSLKTAIDFSDTFILLAKSGKVLGATESEESREDTAHTREVIVEHLKKNKKEILEKTEEWIKEIDSAIDLMA